MKLVIIGDQKRERRKENLKGANGKRIDQGLGGEQDGAAVATGVSLVGALGTRQQCVHCPAYSPFPSQRPNTCASNAL